MDVIRLNNLLSIGFTLVIITLLIAMVSPVSASGTWKIENYIDVDFDVEMQSATSFDITAEVYVNKLTLTGSGTIYTHSDIASIASTNPEMLGAIKQELKILLTTTLSETFKNADISSQNILLDYDNGKFYDQLSVNLTSEFFDLNESVDAYDLVNGLIDVGAIVDYNFELCALPGWNNTYLFNLGPMVDYASTNGLVDEDTIEWDVRNFDGESPIRSADLSIRARSPTGTCDGEDVLIEFNLDARNEKTSLSSNINANVIDISKYDVLPSFISNITYVPSDGIRLLVANGLLSLDEFYESSFVPIKNQITSIIESSLFNQTLDMKFSWDDETSADILEPYNVKDMDSNPSFIGIFTDEEVDLKLYGQSIRAVFGLVNSGATSNVSQNDINFGDDIEKIGYPYSVNLLMPEDVSLNEENIFTWNDTISFSGMLSSKNATIHSEADIKTIIEIEVESTDLNLISFFTGHTELNLGLHLREVNNYNVSPLPDVFSLPDKISLDFLTSDAFRLCINEMVFDQEDVNDFLSSEKDNFIRNVKEIFPEITAQGNVNKKTFEKSLIWDNDINSMDAQNPVKTESYSHTSQGASFDLSIIPPGVKIPSQRYNFTSMEGKTVTYKMIFPSGLNIVAEDTLDKVVVNQDENGKYYFEISFDASEQILEDIVKLRLIPSGLFILGILMPCILSLIITIILIVVIVLIRRKRKGRIKQPKKAPEESYEEGYENEDYYVPPQPPSKK